MTTIRKYSVLKNNPLSDINSSECAFHKAEQRGFEPGHELEDWLMAEQEIKILNFYFCKGGSHETDK